MIQQICNGASFSIQVWQSKFIFCKWVLEEICIRKSCRDHKYNLKVSRKIAFIQKNIGEKDDREKDYSVTVGAKYNFMGIAALVNLITRLCFDLFDGGLIGGMKVYRTKSI